VGNEKRKQSLSLNATGIVFALLLITSFLLLFFSTKTFVLHFKDFGLSLFSGMRNGVYHVSSAVTGAVDAARELAVLRTEYAELTERVARYERMERSAADVMMENRRLREQLEYRETAAYRSIPAEIIARDPDNLFSAFAINKGSAHGVAVDMPVIAYQNGVEAIAGKVIQAAKFESLVMPLYDSRSFVAARLFASRYEGIVGGQGVDNAPLVMRFIQKRALDEINPGDLVVTSGMGRVFPPDVVIGRVTDIFFEEYETSMEARLEPVVDYSRLEYVFVAAGAAVSGTDLSGAEDAAELNSAAADEGSDG
jgi:rod shape-determining protein MreC